jgi:hypothetical protein
MGFLDGLNRQSGREKGDLKRSARKRCFPKQPGGLRLARRFAVDGNEVAKGGENNEGEDHGVCNTTTNAPPGFGHNGKPPFQEMSREENEGSEGRASQFFLF